MITGCLSVQRNGHDEWYPLGVKSEGSYLSLGWGGWKRGKRKKKGNSIVCASEGV